MTPAELAEQARAVLLARRWPMVPSTGQSKGPCVAWKRHQAELPTLELIDLWAAKYKPVRWGVVTGQLAGVIVADFDGNVGRELMNKWNLQPHCRTGSGGFHVYVKHPGWKVPTLNAKSAKQVWPWPGLDIRGDGGFAVLLGKNENGPYVQLRELDPDPFAILPVELRDFLRSHGKKGEPEASAPSAAAGGPRVDSERLIRKALDSVGASGRNSSGFWLVTQLRDNGFTPAEAERALRDYAGRCPGTNAKGEREAYTEAEMRASLREAFSRPAREPWAGSLGSNGGSRPVMAAVALIARPDDPGPSVEECYGEARVRLSGSSSRGGDDWMARFIVGRDGPRPNLANALTAFRWAPEWRGVLAWNDFSNRVVTLRPPPFGGQIGDWTDHEDRLAADWLQHRGVGVSVEVAGQGVQAAARDRLIHPVREYLERCFRKWDQTGRIENLCPLYFGTEASDYAAAVGSRFMVSAVARAFEPGCKVDTCLILEGPQGLKKSTALRKLAEPWFSDELADLGSKDASLQTRGIWVIEIAELDAMTRAEISKIKAFMSRAVDRFRPPYGRHLLESPRQCVFAGSVNKTTYLRDETGARRFWPVACSQVRVEELERDRDQLWGEAVAWYRQRKTWWLDTPELVRQAEEEQSQRFEESAWDGLILSWIEARLASGHNSVSTAEVLEMALNKRAADWTRADEMRVGSALTQAGWKRCKIQMDIGAGESKRQWRYVPNRK